MSENELEKWICDTTGEKEIEVAKAKVVRAIEVLSVLPQIGALTIIVSPAGILDTTISQKLVSTVSGVENVEMSLLQLQQSLIQTRRAVSAQQQAKKATEEEKSDEQAEDTPQNKKPAPKQKRKRRSTRNKEAIPAPKEVKEKVD